MSRYRFLALLGGSAAICAAWTIAPSSAVCQDAKKTAKPNSAANCLATKKDSAPVSCDKHASVGGPMRASQHPAIEPATWRLTRTPNLAGGPDSISIARIAEATRPDQDVTGLMLRCAEGATTEVLVVLIKSLPSQTHPKVTISAGAATTQFTGTVLTSGDLVLLPEKASALVERAWQSIPELTVSIAEDRRSLHGVIPVADMRTAMQTLQSNCLR
jgi:cellobiose-specific phosphotransferase system component IIB